MITGVIPMGTEMLLECRTIGHSTLDVWSFIAMLNAYGVNCIIDVRSLPYSRYNPQFNRENLQQTLEEVNISYFFMGDSLGARYNDPAVWFDDSHKVDFEKVRELPKFKEGIQEVIDLLKEGYRAALMCAEKDPKKCHRFVLVSYALKKQGVDVSHIISLEAIESQEELEEELLKEYKIPKSQSRIDAFFPSHKPAKDLSQESREISLEEVYKLRNKEIAYSAKSGESVAE